MKHFNTTSKIYKILIFSLQSQWQGLFAEESEAVHYSVPSYLAPNEGLCSLDGEHLTNHSQILSSICGVFYPEFIYSRLWAVQRFRRNVRHSCNFESKQVTQRNKLQQKHLPMPTLVNCSPARDWVISIHFKFHRLRDVRSFVDKCLTGTPGTPLKVFSWIIPVYIRKCLLVSLPALTYSVISFHRSVCSRSGGFLPNRLVE